MKEQIADLPKLGETGLALGILSPLLFTARRGGRGTQRTCAGDDADSDVTSSLGRARLYLVR